jgi:hypothetical protein
VSRHVALGKSLPISENDANVVPVGSGCGMLIPIANRELPSWANAEEDSPPQNVAGSGVAQSAES